MNKKIVTALYLSLLIITGCSGPSQEQQMATIKGYLEQGSLKSALIELKNVLQQSPDNSEARVLLGRLYLKASNFAAAEKELKRAQELGADDNGTLSYLSEALLQLRKLDEVLALNEERLNNYEKGRLIASKALAQYLRGNNKRAVELTEDALRMAPESAYVHVARASSEFLVNRSVEASRKHLQAAFDIDKEFAPAWSMLGDIEASEKNLELALASYDKALTIQPTNLTDRNKRVSVNLMLQNYEKAQYDLDILKKQLPGNPGVNFSQGLLYLAQGNLADAKSSFDLALLDQDRYPMSLFYIALVNHLQGSTAQAETQAEQFFNDRPEHMPGRKLLADIKFSQGEYATVIELLEPMLEAHPNDSSLLTGLARAYIEAGRSAEGIALLRNVVKQQPESIEARISLGSGLLSGGFEEEGFAELEKAIQKDADDHQADVFRVLSYIQFKRLDAALEAAKDFEKRAPDSDLPNNLLGLVYLAREDKELAKQVLKKSWNIKPGNTDAGLNLAMIAIQENKLSEAKKYLEESNRHHPDNLQVLLRMAELSQMQGEMEQFVQILENTIKRHPAAVQPRLNLARYYMSIGKPAQVTGLIEVLDSEIRKQSNVQEILIYQDLAQGRFAEAEKSALLLLGKASTPGLGHYLLAQAYLGQGKDQETLKHLSESIKLNNDFVPARVAYLKLLAKRKEVGELKTELTELKRLAPDHQEVMRLEFVLEQLNGDQIRALELADKLFTAFPTIENMLALSRQNARIGKPDRAQQVLRRWADEHPDSLRANFLVAESYAQRQEYSDSIKYYKRALELAPEDVVVLNNFAWALITDDPARAVELAKKANDLKPGSVKLMDTLALAYLSNGDPDMALNKIKEVRFLEPDNPTLLYHEAKIRVAAGKKREALEILKRIIKEHQAFDERAAAESLLKQLLSS